MRIERVWALDAALIARAIRAQDGTWGSEGFELADGRAVLSGPGLYVNRALGAGIEEELTDAHLDRLEQRSQAVGVPPAVEVSELTRRSVVDRLTGRGYRNDSVATAMARSLDERLPEVDPAVEIQLVDDRLLWVWMQTTAVGWGHTTDRARRASDAYSRAASAVDEPGLLLARSADDGRPIGCASLAIRDGVATLGGMSTPPPERGRGVQGALIVYRLRYAHERGCDVATTQVVAGGASERNVLRHGFRPTDTKTTFELRGADGRVSSDGRDG